MQVIATATGYFGQLIEAGQQFEVPEGTKGSWFRPVAKADMDAEVAGRKAGKNGTTTPQVDAITKAAK